MLCKRVICLLTLSHGQLVRTKRFKVDRWYSIEAFEFKGADEIVVVDVTPGEPDRVGTARTVERLISEAFIPVTLGGRLRTLDDAKWAFDHGADKLLSSSMSFCAAVAERYGKQAAVFGSTLQELDLGWISGNIEACFEASKTCGEVLVQNWPRDGSLTGYDIATIPDDMDIPYVVGSGCGNADHMIEAFKAGADGCATSCILHFSETTLLNFKRRIQHAGFKVRM